MLEAFFSWWLARLAELVPAGLRRDPAAAPDALLLRIGDSGRIARARRVQGVEHLLADGAPPPAGLPQHLVLPEGFLLERRIELPLAVARDAGRVVALDFDRLTPFTADSAIWDLAPLGEDRVRKMAQFSLGVVPKARLEAWLALARAQGFQPARLECARAGGGPRLLGLETARGGDRRGWLMAGGVAALLVIAVGSPFARQQIMLDRLDQRIAASSDPAALAGRLLRRIAPGGSGADPLIAAQAQAPRALQTLAAVTNALPDDTNLVTLSLQGDQLSIEGTSVSAPQLIGLLSAQALIRDPSFSSPVTRTDDGKDAFTLAATVAP